jgi:hypothetical protein
VSKPAIQDEQVISTFAQQLLLVPCFLFRRGKSSYNNAADDGSGGAGVKQEPMTDYDLV